MGKIHRYCKIRYKKAYYQIVPAEICSTYMEYVAPTNNFHN